MNNYKKAGLISLVGATVVLSGCSTTGTSGAVSAKAAEAARVQELDRRAAELDAREQELNSLTSGTAASGLPSDAAGVNDLLPPNAAAGECYARVWVEAQYTTREERVLASEASSTIEVIPAQYEATTESVQVSAASTRIETIPAVYGEESETFKIRDGQRIWRVDLQSTSAPASNALLSAATAHGINLDSAEVGMCFHEHYVPATYKTVSDQVLTKAATESVQIIPAQYEMVEEQLLVKEASTKLVNIPAEFAEEEERILDKPAHTIWKKGQGSH